MGVKFNPLIFSGLDFSGGGTSTWGAPVADEASLPVSGSAGEARVVLDTDHIYVWDITTSQWIDQGITASSFGSTPNSNGYTINLNDKGNNVTEQQLILQPADGSNPGGVSIVAQSFAGDKTFTEDVTVNGDLIVVGDTYAQDQLNVTDHNITVNVSGNDASSEGAGITVERVGTDGSFVYEDALTSKFKLGELGSEHEIVTVGHVQTITANKTLSGIINLSSLTASTPLKLDGSNNIVSADIDLTTDVTGVLPIANGGTNSSTAPSNGELLIGNGTDFSLATLTGTANQVTITNGSGSVTLSTPQDIATTSSPEFAGLTLTSFSGVVKSVAGVLSASSLVDADIDASAAIDATKIADGSVTSTEFQYINTLSSNAQDQLDNKQPLDNTLTSLAGYNTDGILTQTAADTFVGRTLTAGSAKITIVDGDGVSGNPTIDVDSSEVLGAAEPSVGDVKETEVALAESQTNTTIFTLNASARSADILISTFVDATSNVASIHRVMAFYDGSDWTASVEKTGSDDVIINVDTSGNIQYTSTTYAGFVGASSKIKYRVISTTI